MGRTTALLILAWLVTGFSAAASAQETMIAPWVAGDELLEPETDQQLAPPEPRLTRAQRDGMLWGFRAGLLTGLAVGAVLLDRYECEGMNCLAPAAPILYLGLLPPAVGLAGGGVGLIVGTIVDSVRPRRTYVGVGFRVRGPF